MEEPSIEQSVTRIEAALARLEAASRKAAGLRRRHEDFKASVASSIEELDILLAARKP